MISSLRCSEHFSELFSHGIQLGACVFSTLTPLHRTTCTEKHSICELLRRIPSLCLALSIELAFAAHCMHARTHYRHVAHVAVLEMGQRKVLQNRFHEQESFLYGFGKTC